MTMTKKMQGFYDSYVMAIGDSLYCGYTFNELYTKHSESKERAYHRCQIIAGNNEGWFASIVHHNSYYFTYGFLSVDKFGNEYFHYITKDNEYKEPTGNYYPYETKGAWRDLWDAMYRNLHRQYKEMMEGK